MKWSAITLHTLRENPADAEMESHRLLVRGGYIKKLAPGIFSYGFLLLHSIRRLENIIREELSKVGAHEILMPMVQPAELWQESGRWPLMTELLKFKNKNQQDFCLGATHEEAIVDFVRNDLKSYRDLPANIYQIQTKYRDEIRPRFGLMRGREFIMKDAYTFDVDKDAALANYEKMRGAYQAIFARLGVDFVVVKADSGAIGGDLSQEFQVIAAAGMDRLLTCNQCHYAGNVEIVPINAHLQVTPVAGPLEKIATPGLRTIAELSQSLNLAEDQLVKTFFVKYQDEKMVWQTATLLVPGDREVNLVKVAAHLRATSEVEPLTENEIRELTGAWPGSCGPVGLNNIIIMDPLLRGLSSMVVGANEDDYHLRYVVPGRDFQPTLIVSIAEAKGGDPCPDCGAPLQAKRGIEVGHIFYLGVKYAKPMGLKYLDKNGKAQDVEMGCYGIGVTRTLQAVIEQNHDAEGMIWPPALAPFHFHFCLLDPKDEQCMGVATDLAQQLNSAGYSVFTDDRDERPGIKFKDADLLGMPIRVTIGKRGVENGELEVFVRRTKEKSTVSIADGRQALSEILRRCP